MTNRELESRLRELVLSERKITNEILELISFAIDKRSYLELGFSSMFDWLTRGFGYSNAAAHRRFEAAKLLKSMSQKIEPEISEKLESGKLNLSTLSKTQSFIKAEEKRSGCKVETKLKHKILKEIENKSVQETEQILISTFPEAASQVYQDRRTVINESTTRLSLNLSNKSMDHLKRAKEVLSHKFPDGKDSDILAYALDFLLDQKDPLRKKTVKSKIENSSSKARVTSAAEASRIKISKAGIRRTVIKNSEASCSFQDPITGRKCQSRYQVQTDHIIPKALGGGDHPENLRALCRQHNLFEAERILGRGVMGRYRSPGLGK